MKRMFEDRMDFVDTFEDITFQVNFMSAACIALGSQDDACMTEGAISGMDVMFDSINDQIGEVAAACFRKLFPEDYEQREGESTVTEELQCLGDLDKDIVSRLAQCREVYDYLKDSKRIEDVLVIDVRLNELAAFIHRAAIPAIGLKEDFLTLRNSIIAEQKNACATEVAGSGV